MEGSKRRNHEHDRIDAIKRARLGRMDSQSLHPMQHRSKKVRRDLVMLRAHDARVAARTEHSSPSFAQKGTEEAVPVEIREPLLPRVGLTPAPSDSIEGYIGLPPRPVLDSCYLIQSRFFITLELHRKGGGRMTSSDFSGRSKRPGEVAET
jgi:hypothetical protein